MDRCRRVLVSVALMLAMVLGSFSFAFGASGDVKIGKMTKLFANSGNDSVRLTWAKVPGADWYEVDRCDANYKPNQKRLYVMGGNTTTFRDKSANTGKVTYYYRVRGVHKNSDGTFTKSNDLTTSGQCIRQMYETIYLNGTYRLSSHGGGSQVTRTFRSSTPLVATGFGGGKFKFWHGTGSNRRLFYAHYTKIRRAYGDYFTSYNYSNATAENFVNDLTADGIVKKSNRSNYLIWVSTNTQHMYTFWWSTKAGGKWLLFKPTYKGRTFNSHWEVATGEAVSPTMISKNLRIQFKDSSHSGIRWWNCFSGYNAIHGKRSSYVIDGRPHSHGCVRNYNINAEYIYKKIPTGTPVVIY